VNSSTAFILIKCFTEHVSLACAHFQPWPTLPVVAKILSYFPKSLQANALNWGAAACFLPHYCKSIIHYQPINDAVYSELLRAPLNKLQTDKTFRDTGNISDKIYPIHLSVLSDESAENFHERSSAPRRKFFENTCSLKRIVIGKCRDQRRIAATADTGNSGWKRCNNFLV
jgi:hypothetical protein